MLKSLLAAVVTLALLTCPFPARAYEKTILKVGMGDPIDSEMGAIGTRFKEARGKPGPKARWKSSSSPPASSATKRK